MMKNFTAFAAILLTACSQIPQSRVAYLRQGMTKQELIQLLGQPASINVYGALTTYNYDIPQRNSARNRPERSPVVSYYVVLGRDDRVRSFNQN